MRKESVLYFLCFLMIKVTVAYYDVEVNLIQYQRDKDCSCDRVLFGCFDCDPFFTICLSTNATGSKCKGGDSSKRVDNVYNFAFSDHKDIPSSFTWQLPHWEEFFKVTIQVQDYDQIGSDYDLGTVSYSYVGQPTNISSAVTNIGEKNLRFAISVQMTCVPLGNFVCDEYGNMTCKHYYYGDNCDTFCQPSGQKNCTSNGTVLCQPDYYGPNCTIHCIPGNEKQLCASDGSLVCKENYYGPSCLTYCKETGNELCDTNGTSFCRPGFTGPQCGINIDDCIGSPCSSNSTCVDMVNGYLCICTAGYTGKTCTTNIDECSNSPCKNGTCVDGINNFTCYCDTGFTGITCDSDIDECSSSPCVNGTCLNEIDLYRCICDSGFNGVNCEQNIDECASSPCKNGMCLDGVDTFMCACNPGFTGITCEYNVLGNLNYILNRNSCMKRQIICYKQRRPNLYYKVSILEPNHTNAFYCRLGRTVYFKSPFLTNMTISFSMISSSQEC